MFERARDLVVRFLRVPPEPTPPDGGRVIRIFRASPNYFRYRMVKWTLGQAAALTGLMLSLIFAPLILQHVPWKSVAYLIGLIEVAAWGAYLVQLPFTYVVVRLDLEMRWYILSDRSLRIREGVVSVREKTVTFANIQQISIRQNPLQRLLGISDVKVRTAGGGGSSGGNTQQGQVGESMHEAFFRGVDNAEEIRTAILERVRRHLDSGLGDPDEPSVFVESEESDSLAAAKDLHQEIRLLRESLTVGRSSDAFQGLQRSAHGAP